MSGEARVLRARRGCGATRAARLRGVREAGHRRSQHHSQRAEAELLALPQATRSAVLGEEVEAVTPSLFSRECKSGSRFKSGFRGESGFFSKTTEIDNYRFAINLKKKRLFNYGLSELHSLVLTLEVLRTNFDVTFS